ncbi:uncharacterized protein VTP21DRAFT_3713 [Calcarisporiella thermophila]|uniref:uncharacterized protein n=1 Tax=Calcarisporiella thermophila TaxID=911321 RepID=UPI003743742C
MENFKRIDLEQLMSSVEISQKSSNVSGVADEGDLMDPMAASPIAKTTDFDSKKILRYSRKMLLALRESPLVNRPDDLPPIESWFGEYPPPNRETHHRKYTDGNDSLYSFAENGENKSALTEGKSRGEKNIVLGPPKMNFASSSSGGLKQYSSEEKAVSSPRSSGQYIFRQRQAGEDLRSGRSNIGREDTRAQRGILNQQTRSFNSNEKTSSEGQFNFREVRNRQERNTLSGQGDRTFNRQRREGENMHFNKREAGRSGRDDQGFFERSEKPEWMDYDPAAEQDKQSALGNEMKAPPMQDLEEWKARMKERDRRQNEKIKKEDSTKTSSRADSSVSWRIDQAEHFAKSREKDNEISKSESEMVENALSKSTDEPRSESLKAAATDSFFAKGGDPSFDSLSAFEKFVVQHNVAIAEDKLAKLTIAKSLDPDSNKTGGSRFAKFFSSRSSEGSAFNTSAVPLKEQPKSISLETLFQSQVPLGAPAQPLSPTTHDESRMLSEAELLQSMGVDGPSYSFPTGAPTEEDIAGFSKVMQVLSKAKDGQSPASNSLTIDFKTSPNPREDTSVLVSQTTLRSITTTELPPDPSIISELSSGSRRHSTISENTQPANQENTPLGGSAQVIKEEDSYTAKDSDDQIEKRKPIHVLFGGNVPTSVYRQLTKKADIGSKNSSASSSPSIKFVSAVKQTSPQLNTHVSPQTVPNENTVEMMQRQQLRHQGSHLDQYSNPSRDTSDATSTFSRLTHPVQGASDAPTNLFQMQQQPAHMRAPFMPNFPPYSQNQQISQRAQQGMGIRQGSGNGFGDHLDSGPSSHHQQQQQPPLPPPQPGIGMPSMHHHHGGPMEGIPLSPHAPQSGFPARLPLFPPPTPGPLPPSPHCHPGMFLPPNEMLLRQMAVGAYGGMHPPPPPPQAIMGMTNGIPAMARGPPGPMTPPSHMLESLHQLPPHLQQRYASMQGSGENQQ